MVGGRRGRRVCVVGAGVIGLTTATLLQEARPDLQVTVMADKFTVDTTSDGAAGIFRPSPSNFCGPDETTTRRWLDDSFQHYNQLLGRPDAETIGLKELWTVILSTATSDSGVKNQFLQDRLPQYRFLTADELKTRPGGPWRHGCRFLTFIVECRRYLPYLMKKFESRGGHLVQRRLTSLVELAGEFEAVVNCSGLAAKELCGDTSLTPIRGQVMKVKAPWVTEGLYADLDTYILPGIDYITIGGTRQFDSVNLAIDKHDSNAMWERALAIMPSLRTAQIVREWTGLRPYRPVVRVEKELVDTPGGGKLKVVHNYGHGGYGVTSAPGTSMAAVTLLLEMLEPAGRTTAPRARL